MFRCIAHQKTIHPGELQFFASQIRPENLLMIRENPDPEKSGAFDLYPPIMPDWRYYFPEF